MSFTDIGAVLNSPNFPSSREFSGKKLAHRPWDEVPRFAQNDGLEHYLCDDYFDPEFVDSSLGKITDNAYISLLFS